ncbi:MAG TPA: hypothetical protein PKD20_02775 [Candidatus Saccharibacteria bacterium]|jgi:F0F1-type ATP synthase delta subunit|nr:hypothetical protein [Candidatus Saccharibacteria bacterium]HMT55775.1 hypothetical protein [Candidatus Saccharibacteria bacterium]
MAHEQRAISIPNNIVSPTDIARLAREIESLDNFFREQAIRASGSPTNAPRVSKLMDQLAADNQLNLLHDADRGQLHALLAQLHQKAPVLHISFSVDPPGPYVQKIVDWLRRNIDPHVLVTVGLQPNIGAGCVVRTTNKLFDFSLREYFYQQREFFIQKLHQVLVGDNDLALASATASTATSQIQLSGASLQGVGQNVSPSQPVVPTTQQVTVAASTETVNQEMSVTPVAQTTGDTTS